MNILQLENKLSKLNGLYHKITIEESEVVLSISKDFNRIVSESGKLTVYEDESIEIFIDDINDLIAIEEAYCYIIKYMKQV